MFPLSHFPELPSAKTLLIKGDYHPSAPVHFCISHLSQTNDEDTAVFITPSKESFVQTLVSYNDRWLGEHGGNGDLAKKLVRVKVLFVAQTLPDDWISEMRDVSSYPMTVHQLAVLLSVLHYPSSGNPELDPKVVLSAPPTLIILHDVSSLFLSPELEWVGCIHSYLANLPEERLAPTI